MLTPPYGSFAAEAYHALSAAQLNFGLRCNKLKGRDLAWWFQDHRQKSAVIVNKASNG
jgi:hypothetical protein